MSQHTLSSADVELARLEEAGVHYVRLTWIDLTNFIRFRVIPTKQFRKLFESKRPGVMVTKASLGLVFLTLAPGFGPSGEYLYTPDLDSARLLGYSGKHLHASVFGWFEEKPNLQNPRSPLCPRSILKKIEETANRTHGLNFQVGFETEFILLKSATPLKAVNDHGWSISAATLAGTVETTVMEEIAEALSVCGVELCMYHSEGAPGQYEVVTGHLSPLKAVDALILTRETVYNIASKHGLRATLSPRLFSDSCGSASHTHISVAPPSNFKSDPIQVTPTDTITSLEGSFLQGILNHLPAITAFTLPTVASYGRMMDGVWSGGTWVAWGRDNRECPVRLCGMPGSYNFELKCLDGTANPYLAIAAILSAGYIGIKHDLKLSTRDCSKNAAAMLSAEERKALGIMKRMPLSIHEARDALKNDVELTKELGKDLVEAYIPVNETLEKTLKRPSEEETISLLIETY